MTQPNFDHVQRIEPSALESIQRAEIDIQITTAKRYPRQLSLVKQDMLSFATLDQETAESCFYTLPRGGKNIQGPSVRLAEIAVSCYGNLRVGSRVVGTVTDGPNPHVTIQSVCHDLEKNIAVTMEKRRRITKKRSKDTIDEDDINLAANAGAAIAFRDAVFKVVPLALVKPVFDAAKLVAIGDAKTLVDRRARMVETFGKMGVTLPMILGKLAKRGLDDIDLADIGLLIGLHTALKDGDTTIDEVFSPPKASKPTFEIVKEANAEPKAEVSRETLRQDDPNNPPMEPGIADAIAEQISEKATVSPAQFLAEQIKASAAAAGLPAAAVERQVAAEKKSVRAKAGPVQEPPGPKEMLINAGVPFDDFTDWMLNTGRNRGAKAWGTYDDVPEAVWKGLEKDSVGLGKCATLYGKTSPAAIAVEPAQ